VDRAFLLATTVVLARLLTPEEFGLVSLSLVLIVYAHAVADAGVGQALIYLPRTAAIERAALACSLAMGLGLLVLALAAAPLIGAFFDRPDVVPLVRLLAVSLLASAVAAVPDALLRRDMLFPRVTAAAVARTVVTGGVAIGLALAGYGAWSLAWSNVAGAVTYLVGCLLVVPDRPHLAFWRARRPDLRRVLGYGMPVSSSQLLSRIVFDVDYLIVGRVLGATALGYYTLAFRLPEMLIINVFFILASVTFPIFSRVRDDPPMMRAGYLFSVRLFALYGVCAGVGLAVTAPLVVPTVFGDQWDGAVVPLIGLALYAAFRTVGGGANEVYKAMGRPGLSALLSLVRLAVLVPALWLAAQWWGIAGVAWAQLVTAFLFAMLMQGVAARVLQLRWRELGRALLPAVLTGAAIAVVAWPLTRLPLAPALALGSAVVGGIVVAAGVLRLAFPELVRQLMALARRRSVTP
jgi:PST family polysaccharide transporter